jgi:hypothetical protein
MRGDTTRNLRCKRESLLASLLEMVEVDEERGLGELGDLRSDRKLSRSHDEAED